MGDNTIHWVNVYPVNSTIGFPDTYPLDGTTQRLNNLALDGKLIKAYEWSSHGTALIKLKMQFDDSRFQFSSKWYSSKRDGDTPLSGPKQGCAVEQGTVLEVSTLKQAEGFKIGHVWSKQFC